MLCILRGGFGGYLRISMQCYMQKCHRGVTKGNIQDRGDLHQRAPPHRRMESGGGIKRIKESLKSQIIVFIFGGLGGFLYPYRQK